MILSPRASGLPCLRGTPQQPQGAQKKDGRPAFRLQRPSHTRTGWGRSLRRRSSPARLRWLLYPSVGRAWGLSFDPQASWPAHLVHPCKRCGSSRVADRLSALHPEAPNRGGWSTRLAPTVRIGWPPGSPEPSGARGTSRSSPDDPSGPKSPWQPLMSSAVTSPWSLR